MFGKNTSKNYFVIFIFPLNRLQCWRKSATTKASAIVYIAALAWGEIDKTCADKLLIFYTYYGATHSIKWPEDKLPNPKIFLRGDMIVSKIDVFLCEILFSLKCFFNQWKLSEKRIIETYKICGVITRERLWGLFGELICLQTLRRVDLPAQAVWGSGGPCCR